MKDYPQLIKYPKHTFHAIVTRRVRDRERLLSLKMVLTFFQKRPDVFSKTSRCFFRNVLMFFQKRPDVFPKTSRCFFRNVPTFSQKRFDVSPCERLERKHFSTCLEKPDDLSQKNGQHICFLPFLMMRNNLPCRLQMLRFTALCL